MSYFEFPHTRTYEGDLGYVISQIIELTKKYDTFFAYNSIKFADPIEWDITTQYAAYTIVFDSNDEYSYISKKPVPAGITLDNTDFWEVLGSMLVDGAARAEIERILRFISNIYEISNIASADRDQGDYFVMGGYLWKTTTAVLTGETYTDGVNCEKISIEDMIREIASATITVDSALNILSNNAIANRPVAVKFINIDTAIANINNILTTIGTSITNIESDITNIESDITNLRDDLTSETSNRENADNTLSTRIDNIVALPVGSTTGDAELMDGRTSYTGRVYTNIGGAIRGQATELHNAIKYGSSKTVVDYAAMYSWVPGTLDNTGAVAADSSYMALGDYIPVTLGEILHFINSNANYTMVRCLYDSGKTLVNRTVLTASENDRIYGVTSGVAFVRIAIGINQTADYHIYSEDTSVSYLESESLKFIDDDLNRIESSINNIDVGHKYGWRPGTLNTSTGVVDDTNFSYYTTDFIPVIEGNTLVLNLDNSAAYQLSRALYDENKTFISGASISVSDHTRLYAPTPGVRYIRYCISFNAYRANHVSLYFENQIKNNALYLETNKHDRTVRYYSGTPLDLSVKHEYSVSQLIPYVDTNANAGGDTAQGIAIYGDTLFQFISDDKVRIYDIAKKGEMIGAFSVPSSGHGNTACFSDTKFDAADDFPLIYVSDITGYVREYRISTSSAVLVQTFSFDTSTFGLCPQMTLDNDNQVAYIVGVDDPNAVTTLTITKCDMNNLIDNGDSTYTPATIESYQVSLPNIPIVAQGVKFLNKNIYFVSGANAGVDSTVFAISTTTKDLAAMISDFPSDISTNELEDIAFYNSPDGCNYNMVLHVRTLGYFRAVF